MTTTIYHVGGTVPIGRAIYIERTVDTELLRLCLDGTFVYILTARQLGKSSLMVHTAQHLEARGIRTVKIDLQVVGKPELADQWYLGLLMLIGDRLDLKTDIEEWWEANAHLSRAQRLRDFFGSVLLDEIETQVVIFIDEIDTTIGLDYTDDFFAVVRSLYNARADTSQLQRLAFVLIGVAQPGRLIKDSTRSPFNIGQRLMLDDFTSDQARPLATGFGLPPQIADQVLHWTLTWTNGHPYLTQYLCSEIVRYSEQSEQPIDWSEAEVARIVQATLLGEQSDKNSNLQFVRDMLTRYAPTDNSAGVLRIYRDVRRGKKVDDDEQSNLKSHLKLSGIVRREQHSLQIRNRIYAEVFDERWIHEHWPLNWWQTIPTSFKIGTILLISLLIVLVFITISLLNEQRLSRQRLREGHAAQAIIQLEEKRPEQSVLFTVASIPSTEESASTGAMWRLALNRVFNAINLRTILNGHKGFVQGVVWSPDGQRVATSSCDGTVRTWNPTTGEQLHVWLVNTESCNDSIAWSPDGNRLLVGGWGSQARIVDAATGQVIHVLQHRCAVHAIAWSPDGKYVLTGNGNWDDIQDDVRNNPCANAEDLSGTAVRIWDAETGSFVRMLNGPAKVTWSVAWSPDGRYLLSGGADRTAKIWDAETGKELQQFADHSDGILSVAWSPDGHYVVTGCNDGTVRIWNVATKALEHQLIGHTRTVWSVAWSPDGKHILTGSVDATARLWDATSGQQLAVLTGHKDFVQSVAFSPDGRLAITGSHDGTARIWDVTPSGTLSTKLMAPTQQKINAAAWHPTQPQVLIGSQDGIARIWDTRTGQLVRGLVGHTNSVTAVAWSPDGRQAITGSADGTARIWNTATGQLTHTLEGHTDAVVTVAWSPDGKQVLTGSYDSSVQVWDANSGKPVRNINCGNHVAAVAWNPKNAHEIAIAISGDQGKTVWVLDTTKPEDTVLMINAGRDATAVAWSPDGTRLATGSFDPYTVNIWDITRLRNGSTSLPIQALVGHTDSVWSITWSPDGEQLLTASADSDSTVRLWDAALGTQLRTIHTNVGRNSNVTTWSPDGQFIVTGDDSGVVHIWLAGTRLMGAELTRRLCHLNVFNDSQIKDVKPDWRGCDAEIKALSSDLDEYDQWFVRTQK